MWNFLKQLFEPEPDQLTLVHKGPVRVSVERLGESFTLHLSGQATIQDSQDTASFSLEISDTKSLSDLCGMIHRAMHPERADPPSLPYLDTSLLPGEPESIYEDINKTLGAEYALMWLDEANLHLGGQTPHRTIRDGDPFRVRLILRGLKHIGMT